MLAQEADASAYGGGRVLRDDFNPVDVLSAPTAGVWRGRTREATLAIG
jgi:hypothetical protein